MSIADSSSLSSLSPPPSSDEGRAPTPPPRKIIIPPKTLVLKSKKKKEQKENEDEFATDEEELAAQAAERSPSPPHETVLADNPDIAFIVMFRARFSDAFPKSLAHFGPQDIEKGIVDALPTPQVESLLCALLALVLNRKKPIERGHHGRALEEALQSQKNEWPRSWEGKNPLSGGKSFNTMDPAERLGLLRALVLWSLHTSEAVSGIIKENYKVSRREDDKNIPLSVQPWGQDIKKHRYWLIEGLDDTSFRIYRESNNVAVSKVTTAAPADWRSIVGSIDELREMGEKLGQESAQSSRRLSVNILGAIPRFEATEEKRKRREYRMARKAQFSRPEPGFSLYEGRTRGKRMKYTFSDDDNDYDSSDAQPYARRSLRHAPAADPSKPVVTASGRQSKPSSLLYGDSASTEQQGTEGSWRGTGSPVAQNGGSDIIGEDANDSRPTRSGRGAKGLPRAGGPGRHIDGYNSVDEMDDEDEAEASSSDGDGGEWDGGEDEYDDAANGREGSDADDDDDDDEMSEDNEDQLDGIGDGSGEVEGRRTKEKQSFVIQLRYGKRIGEEGGGGSEVSTHHQDEYVKNEHVGEEQRENDAPNDQIMDDNGESLVKNGTDLYVEMDVAKDDERPSTGDARKVKPADEDRAAPTNTNDATIIAPPASALQQQYSAENKPSPDYQPQLAAPLLTSLAPSVPSPNPLPTTEPLTATNKLNSNGSQSLEGNSFHSNSGLPQVQPPAAADLNGKPGPDARLSTDVSQAIAPAPAPASTLPQPTSSPVRLPPAPSSSS